MKNRRTQRFNEFVDFILERYAIFVKKEAGAPKPWTTNPILQQYRFTNIHRENDAVTRWITANWLQPHSTDPDLWFAMLVARFLNYVPTLRSVGYPVPFRYAEMRRKLEWLAEQPEKMFTSAYVVKSLQGRKIDYVLDCVFKPLWARRKELRPLQGESLLAYYQQLRSCYGLGSFMAGQIIADLKHALPLADAPDWWTWAASGPGSRRGLRYLQEGGTIAARNVSWSEETFLRELRMLKAEVDPILKKKKIPPLCAQNLQNCLCEMSKVWKVMQGVGRPKQKYNGV